MNQSLGGGGRVTVHGFDRLNPQQQQAVAFGDGPLLIVAGAGSGKTRTLTMRIASLIEDRGVPARAILAVTFTNKAAREMRERLFSLLGVKAQGVDLTTFHSWCCRLLRRWHREIDYPPGFTIFDDEDQEKVLRDCAKRMDLDTDRVPLRLVRSLISEAKNELRSPEEFRPDHPQADRIREMYQLYQEALALQKACDFDDLIMRTWQLLTARPDLLEKLHRQYNYFLVDEYQDTNIAQYRLLALLAKASNNICVVGDEDQSIYGWRGADIRNILDFEKDFVGATTIVLDQNYRSTQKILDAASAVIARNKSSRGKKLWTERGDGELLHLLDADSDRDEADRVVGEIRRLVNAGTPLSGIAVLYRMNSQSRELERALVRSGFPYEVYGGTKFFQRREIKDVLAYLRVLVNPDDAVALARIINTPPRGIGATTQSRLEAMGPLFAALFAERKSSKKLGEFCTLLEHLQEQARILSVSALTRVVIDEIGYVDYLKKDDPDTAEDRIGNVEGLVSDIVEQEEANPELTLMAYLEQVALHAEVDELRENTDKVHLLTLHNAKGLEFPVVFLIGLEEGVFPHHSCIDFPERLEEERRLAYVGMTRAEKRLYLCCARQRLVFGRWNANAPSRFLGEVPVGLFVENTLSSRIRAHLSGRPVAGVPIGAVGARGRTFVPAPGTRMPGGSAAVAGRPSLGLPPGAAVRTTARIPVPGAGRTDAGAARDAGARADEAAVASSAIRALRHAEKPGMMSVPDVGMTDMALANMANTTVGCRVWHQVFGQGRVRAVEGNRVEEFRVTIDFERAGSKTLLLQYASLRIERNNS